MIANQFTEEHAVRFLKAVESGGKKAEDPQSQTGISAAAFNIWKRKYDDLEVSKAKSLQALALEKNTLKPPSDFFDEFLGIKKRSRYDPQISNSKWI